MSTVTTFHCKNCGLPLDIPKNSKGKVVCPACHTESVIESLVKNEEIRKKENINSGIPLSAGVPALHQCVLDALTASPSAPLDVLEASEIIEEKHICVPAFLFSCNGTGSYNYEAGNPRVRDKVVKSGKNTKVVQEQYTEWSQCSGTASMSKTYMVSGNRKMTRILQTLYPECNMSDLVDAEFLEYPADVDTYDADLPHVAAFNEQVRPMMEKSLEAKAKSALAGKTFRGLVMGGCSIQKDEMIRAFVGIYQIDYIYNGSRFSLYVTGDGSHWFYESVPQSSERRQKWDDLQNKKKELQSQNVSTKAPKMAVGIIAAVIGLIFLFMSAFLVGIILILIGALLIFLKVHSGQKVKGLQAQIEDVDRQLQAYSEEVKAMKEDFIRREQPIRGIYAGYSE